MIGYETYTTYELNKILEKISPEIDKLRYLKTSARAAGDIINKNMYEDMIKKLEEERKPVLEELNGRDDLYTL